LLCIWSKNEGYHQDNSVVVPNTLLLAMLRLPMIIQTIKDFEEFKDGAEEIKRLVQIWKLLNEQETFGFNEILREELGKKKLEDSYKYR
jgi:hypothetical protein